MHPTTTQIVDQVFAALLARQETERQRKQAVEATPRAIRLRAIAAAARAITRPEITGTGFDGFAQVLEFSDHPGHARARRAELLLSHYTCRRMGWNRFRSQMHELPALRREEKRRLHVWRSYQNLSAVDHALSLIKEPLQ